MDRKREAFDKWALENLGTIPFSPFLTDILIMNHAWQAYQQAYKDMYPVFDRIDELIRDGGCLYRPCLTTDHWEINNFDDDIIATGETFRELCVNLIMADGKDCEVGDDSKV